MPRGVYERKSKVSEAIAELEARLQHLEEVETRLLKIIEVLANAKSSSASK